jgi:putative flavoprotein involved in K+ transport
VSTNNQTDIKPLIAAPPQKHFSVIVIGGGQAGLSASYLLKERGIDHIVFEKNRPQNPGGRSDGRLFVSLHPTGNASCPVILIPGPIHTDSW